MGLLGDLAMGLAKGAYNSYKEKDEKFRKYYDDASDRSDEWVMNGYRNTSIQEKRLAYAAVLKERGLL